MEALEDANMSSGCKDQRLNYLRRCNDEESFGSVEVRKPSALLCHLRSCANNLALDCRSNSELGASEPNNHFS